MAKIIDKYIVIEPQDREIIDKALQNPAIAAAMIGIINMKLQETELQVLAIKNEPIVLEGQSATPEMNLAYTMLLATGLKLDQATMDDYFYGGGDPPISY